MTIQHEVLALKGGLTRSFYTQVMKWYEESHTSIRISIILLKALLLLLITAVCALDNHCSINSSMVLFSGNWSAMLWYAQDQGSTFHQFVGPTRTYMLDSIHYCQRMIACDCEISLQSLWDNDNNKDRCDVGGMIVVWDHIHFNICRTTPYTLPR